MSADISGFTALSERLAGSPGGNEELSETLNEYFGTAIDLVYSHGGDVVEFAGDSFFALWRGDSESIELAALRAACCAELLSSAIGSRSSPHGQQISARLYMGAGKVSVVRLDAVRGSSAIYVGGEPFKQIRTISHHGVAGHVLISSQAWQFVAGHAEGHSLADGTARLVRTAATPPPVTASPSPPIAAAQMLPAIVMDRVRAAPSEEWMAETRQATMAFLRVESSSELQEQDAPRLSLAATTIRDAVEEFEGSTLGVEEDDKGTTVVISFGVHPYTHEDDPARAILAVRRVIEALRKCGMSARAGIATGRVFCAPVGTPRRRHFIICGYTVNVAAKLVDVAPPDGIVVDARTQATAGARIDLRMVAPALIKGVDGLISAFRDVGHDQRDRNQLRGRDQERQRMRFALGAARHGGGAVLLIEGEAGSGKTSLVRWFIEQVRESGAECFTGSGDSITRNEPYLAWRPIFESLFRGGAGDQARTEGDESLVEAVLGRRSDRTLPSSTGSPRDRAEAVARLLSSTLSAGSHGGRPQVVVLDDAHWMDSTSWGLLSAVVRMAPTRTLFVLGYRPFGTQPPVELRALIGAVATTHVPVGPLDETVINDIVADLLGTSDIEAGIVQFVNERARGNPLFATEVTTTLAELKLIRMSGRHCEPSTNLRSLRATPLPASIEGIIAGRLTRLGGQEQLVVKVASVLGVEFAAEAVISLEPALGTESEAVDALETVQDFGLVESISGRPGWFRFNHPLIAEISYGLLSERQRRTLHGMAARWYQQRYHDDQTGVYSTIARHWAESDTPEKAGPFLELAAARAQGEFANEEAVGLLRDALRLADASMPRAKRAGLEMRLGQAYVGILRYDEARRHLEAGLKLLESRRDLETVVDRALRFVRRGSDPLRLRTALAVGLQLARVQSLAVEIITWAARSVRGTKESDRQRRAKLREVARAYTGLAEIYYFANEPLLSLVAAFRSLDSGRSLGSSPELAEGYATVGPLLGFAGFGRLAENYFRRGVEIAESLGDGRAATFVGLSAGYYYTGLGNWKAARRHLNETLLRARAMGDWRREADALGNLMAIFWLRGEIDQCRKLAQGVLSEATRRANARYQVEAFQALAYCYLVEEDLAEAERAIESAERLSDRDLGSSVEGLRLELLGLRCIFFARSGPSRYSAALESAEDLNRKARRAPVNYYGALTAYSAPAEVGLALWRAGFQPQSSRRLAKSGLVTLKKYATAFRTGEPRRLALLSIYAHQAGSPRRAVRLKSQAVRLAIALGVPPP